MVSKKMSKSYDNYISISDEPGDMFGKDYVAISDDLMWRYLELLSSLRPSGKRVERKRC